MRPALYLALVILAVLLMNFEAQADETYCGKQGDVVTSLVFKHQERVVATGVTLTGELVELWRNKTLDTWTISMTVLGAPGEELKLRAVCLLAAGDTWIEHPGPYRKASGVR